MRRLLRWLFNGLTALSLLLCVATVVLWVRSYMVPTILVESRPGQFLLVGVDGVPKVVREKRDGSSLGEFLTHLYYWNPPREHSGLGFYLARGGTGIRVVPGDSYPLEYFWVVGIPYWSLLLLTLAHSLPLILLGLSLLAVAIFTEQTVSIGYVALAGAPARSTAVGLYVTCYYIGGSLGGILPAGIWSHLGWPGCVALVMLVQAVALAVAWTVWPRGPATRQG